MKWPSLYIVPTALLTDRKPRDPFHAQAFPADPTLTLVSVHWENWNFEREFEALADVRFLGYPWEPLDGDAVVLIASLPGNDVIDAQSTAPASAIAGIDQPTPPDTLARALRGNSWLRGLMR